MTSFAAQHARELILVTGLLVLLLLASLLWIVRHLERRVQHLEHEQADLRAALNMPGTTPEVIRRYDAIQAAGMTP